MCLSKLPEHFGTGLTHHYFLTCLKIRSREGKKEIKKKESIIRVKIGTNDRLLNDS